ncbi:MAG: PD40 domain-containing protein [Chloroflexi bacterium]|nr:PD40 domain-containing protein [Chloroflexota bacterium]
MLVYQNFDTGNWEVLLNTAAQAKINLSNHPAADIHPRLNRGATHVLFASNRAGNFDLYVMKVDGSNLTQLTASAGDDVNPVWSPDGSKIAFESYRDGQPEIYVMNADGSNQTRLTVSPDFDGMPTWSPDGQTIAFSSRRTGGYRIYTMDAATGPTKFSDLHTLIAFLLHGHLRETLFILVLILIMIYGLMLYTYLRLIFIPLHKYLFQ